MGFLAQTVIRLQFIAGTQKPARESGVMSLIEGGDMDLEKERKPREISKEHRSGSHLPIGGEEGENPGAANIFGFEGLEGCWWRWSPWEGAEWKRTSNDGNKLWT